MDKKTKIRILESKKFDWFEISELLDLDYDEVRNISEEDE